jgi:para-nitrobenzyl esterase
VRDNISAYGGDPDTVTIAGQSAGASAVLALMAMPQAAGLFIRAISESAPVPFSSVADAQQVASVMAADLDIDGSLDGWLGVDEDDVLNAQSTHLNWTGETPPHPMLAFLRSAMHEGGHLRLPFAPVIDGDTLPSMPAEAFAAGSSARVPLLIGATADEFIETGPRLLRRDELESWLVWVGADEETSASVMRSVESGEIDPFGRLMTELFFRTPLLRIADARLEAVAGTWVYDFRWKGPAGLAAHCLELPFVWNNLTTAGVDAALGPTPPAWLAQSMHESWVDFVRWGNPGWDATRGAVSGRAWGPDGVEDKAALFRDVLPANGR